MLPTSPGLALSDDEPDRRPAVLRDRAAAEAYVASVCFKHGPPRLLGVELEWLVNHAADPSRPTRPRDLVDALGPHTPSSLLPGSASRPLPRGSTVTVEPGGQVEIASPPFASVADLVDTVSADVATLYQRLSAAGLRPLDRAADPLRPPRRILDLPRYQAMETAFDRVGPYGRIMMCSTAAVQVCVDAGAGADVATRWTALHLLGPVLLAAFANSPVVHGRSTGWKSSRMASWLALDPVRTAPPVQVSGDPALAWARRAVQTPLLCLRRPGSRWDAPPGLSFGDWADGALPVPPTTADLDYHLTTLFPPVRPHGHIEVRYLDAQPVAEWAAPVALLAALLATSGSTERAIEVCEPGRGRWSTAARHGLADRVLARCAARVFELGCRALPDIAAPPWVHRLLERITEQRVLRGRCPADDPARLTDGRAPGTPSRLVPHPHRGGQRR